MIRSKLAARTLLILGLSLLALLAGQPGRVWANAPEITYGPYLIPFHLDAHKMTLMFTTDCNFGQNYGDGVSLHIVDTNAATTTATSSVEPGQVFYNNTLFRIDITELVPGHYYTYCLHVFNVDGDTTNNGGFLATRDMLPGNSSHLEFLALGDNRSETNGDIGLLMRWCLADAASTYNFHPEFIVHTGDICYDGGGDSSGHDYWYSFLGHDTEWAWLLARYPLMVALGNHDFDVDAGSDTSMWNFNTLLPQFGGQESCGVGDMYYRNVDGQVWFFCLDTFPMDGYCGCGNGCPGLKPGSDQYTWLDTYLSQYDNDPSQWKIVFMHAPLYSPGDCNLYGPNSDLEALLEKHGVDLVLTGHEHYYSRRSVEYGSLGTHANSPIVHLVLGGAGAGISNIEDTTGYDRVVQDWHFADFKIDGDVLQARVVFRGDTPDDVFTIDRTPRAWWAVKPSSTPTPGYSFNFYDTSNGHRNRYLWDFGDGTPTSTEENPLHTYAKDGTYNITITVWSLWNTSTFTSQLTVPWYPSAKLPPHILQLLLLD